MAEFTPGPWKLPSKRDKDFAGACVLDSQGNLIADCNIFGSKVPSEKQCLKNATLLAAAPKLYHALERLTGYGDIFSYREGEENPYKQAIEALREARGEATT